MSNRVVVPASPAGNRFLGSLKGLQIRARITHRNFDNFCNFLRRLATALASTCLHVLQKLCVRFCIQFVYIFFNKMPRWKVIHFTCFIFFLLVLHCKENPMSVLPEKKLRGLIPNLHVHVSVSNLYIPTIGPSIFLQKNRQTDCGNI
jgi:hypothetical protein